MDRREGEKLLEPWLGTGLDLADLPVPRLIVLRLAGGSAPDLSGLRAALAERVPNALLDDHKLWLSRLKAMADTLVGIGLMILTLVLWRPPLPWPSRRGERWPVRRRSSMCFISSAPRIPTLPASSRAFPAAGSARGAAGALGASGFFLVAGLLFGRGAQGSALEQVEALFGRFSLPVSGYLSVLVIGVLVAVVTGIVSRVTVFRTLRGMEQAQ